jgi:glycosyltransferase involved in cell wall biosynthesis
LAAAIRQIVHDKELHAELSKRAQDRAEHFSWQRAAEETLQLFEETLADHQPRAYRHRYLDDLAR